MNVQTTRTYPDHCRFRLDADQLVPLLVEIGQRPTQRLHDVLHPNPLMLPFVDHGIFQVKHHAGRARVQHFHHQVGIVGWTGHLVALVLAPFRQFDSPAPPYRVSWKPVGRLLPLMGFRQNLLAFLDQRPLPDSKAPMQWRQKLQKSLRQVMLGVKCGRRTICLKAIDGNGACGNCGHVVLPLKTQIGGGRKFPL